MRSARFMYRSIFIGTLFYNEEFNRGIFRYRLTSEMIDDSGLKPEALIRILEDIRSDIDDENFDFDNYIHPDFSYVEEVLKFERSRSNEFFSKIIY